MLDLGELHNPRCVVGGLWFLWWGEVTLYLLTCTVFVLDLNTILLKVLGQVLAQSETSCRLMNVEITGIFDVQRGLPDPLTDLLPWECTTAFLK